MPHTPANASDNVQVNDFLPSLYCGEAMPVIELIGGRPSCVKGPAKPKSPMPVVWVSVEQPVRQRPVRVPPPGQRRPKFPRLATDRPGRYSESEMASAAEMMRKLQLGDDVRGDRVARVRESVAGGEYENDMKLEIAADRVLDEIL